MYYLLFRAEIDNSSPLPPFLHVPKLCSRHQRLFSWQVSNLQAGGYEVRRSRIMNSVEIKNHENIKSYIWSAGERLINVISEILRIINSIAINKLVFLLFYIIRLFISY